MLFKDAEPTPEIYFHRRVSQGGRWEIGWKRVIFGVRIEVAQVNGDGPEGFWCCELNQSDMITAWVALHALLKPLSEDIKVGELRRLFPMQDRKPVEVDPVFRNLLFKIINDADFSPNECQDIGSNVALCLGKNQEMLTRRVYCLPIELQTESELRHPYALAAEEEN